MSLKIFDSCLESISIVWLKRDVMRKSLAEVKEGPLTTLGDLVRSYSYLLFYVMSTSTPPNVDFLHMLNKLVMSKNHPGPSSKGHHKNSPQTKLKRLFQFNKNRKENSRIGADTTPSSELGVIVIDVANSQNEPNLSFAWEMEFHYLLLQDYRVKSSLLRSLSFSSAPSLFVVDCADLNVIGQAYRTLMDDPNGEYFPWMNKPISELFQGPLLRNNGLEGTSNVNCEDLAEGVKGIFFGAKWCPPSKQMLQQLCQIYQKIKAENPSFEVIFCSADRSEESFKEHFSSMPWLAFPYGSKISQIAKIYDVGVVPTFILVDGDYSLLTRNGRGVLVSDPLGYPWKRKTLHELTEHTVHHLSESPSLILFTEGFQEDIEFSVQLLGSCGEWLQSHCNRPLLADPAANSSNLWSISALSSSVHPVPSALGCPIQIFYTGEDPICENVLESLGQQQADLPLLLICDVLAGHFAICDKPDVSESVVCEFVAEYLDGRANVNPIPDKRQTTQCRTVGGIPVQLLEPLISHRLQPQNQTQQQMELTRIA